MRRPAQKNEKILQNRGEVHHLAQLTTYLRTLGAPAPEAMARRI
jgi:uncharacterized damage-inducible protein DinB